MLEGEIVGLYPLGQGGPEVYGDLSAARSEQEALDVLRAHVRHVEIALEGVDRQQTVLYPVGEPTRRRCGSSWRWPAPRRSTVSKFALPKCPQRRRHDEGSHCPEARRA